LLSAIIDIFDLDPNVLRTGAAVLLLGFGLLMIWPEPFEWLSIRLGEVMNSDEIMVEFPMKEYIEVAHVETVLRVEVFFSRPDG
jgi:hypothetical protein